MFIAGQSGNPNGRPKGSKNLFCLSEFTAVLKEVEKEKGKSLYKHLIERAYANDKVLVAVANKIIPDLKPVDDDDGELANEEIEIIPKRDDLAKYNGYIQN